MLYFSAHLAGKIEHHKYGYVLQKVNDLYTMKEHNFTSLSNVTFGWQSCDNMNVHSCVCACFSVLRISNKMSNRMKSRSHAFVSHSIVQRCWSSTLSCVYMY